jgi:drug/metabolite transporter (DMT)-like permease
LNPHITLYTLISVMVLLWSANFIVGKIALREFPPLLLGAMRIALAGLFLAPVYWRKARTNGEQIRMGADWFILAFLAICNVGNQVLFLLGLNRTSVSHSALIVGIGPMFVLLITAAMGVERITWRKLGGMLIALAGVTGLVYQGAAIEGPGIDQVKPSLAGDMLTALACLMFSLFAVYAKRATKLYSSVAVNGIAYMGGAALLAPVILWQGRGFSFAHVSAAGWSSLLYMAVFPSVICYLIYYYALGHISASRVSAFIYLEPIIATLLAVAFLGERITAPLVASGTVIFTGVYLTERG